LRANRWSQMRLCERRKDCIQDSRVFSTEHILCEWK
jgi:hypothetical protein